MDASGLEAVSRIGGARQRPEGILVDVGYLTDNVFLELPKLQC